MRKRESGMTMLGMLIVIIVVGAWIYAGIRLAPVYLEHMKIAGTLEKIEDEYSSNPSTTEYMIRKSIERHFDIESVNAISFRDVEIKRDGQNFNVRANYEATAPLVANVYFLVAFDSKVTVAAR